MITAGLRDLYHVLEVDFVLSFVCFARPQSKLFCVSCPFYEICDEEILNSLFVWRIRFSSSFY